MKRPRIIFTAIFLMAVFFISINSASALTPDYQESISIADNNSKNPADWLAPSLITTASPGLQYDGDGNLIVRVATSLRFWTNKTVGDTYTIGPNRLDPKTNADFVTTGSDFTDFYTDHGGGVQGTDLIKIIERGLGINTVGTHDAMIEYAVTTDPGKTLNDKLMRPTKNPDITDYHPTQYGDSLPFIRPPSMTDDTAWQNFQDFYAYWKANSITNATFPWTQLGYTFFWGNGSANVSDIEGMTELIILATSTVKVYSIYTTQSYIYAYDSVKGQYGNGYPDFDITGVCDSVWAGNKFQARVSASSAPGNENTLTVQSGGIVSGGQGILVWSLNYLVENYGSITGTTTNKCGLSDTADIAVLFKGNGDVLGAANQLKNYSTGTISSPGTAVKAEAGATSITNTGTISGTNYAIDIASTSTVDLTNTGGTISSDDYAIYIANTSLDTVTISGGTVSGKISMGIDHADTLTVKDNAKLGFVLDRDTGGTPQIVSGDTAIAESTSVTLAPTVGGTKNVQDAETFLVVDAETLTSTVSNIDIQNDSTHPMITFTARKSGDQLYLDATRDNSYYANNSGNASLGQVVDSLANTSTGAMADLIGALDGSGSAANAKQLEPQNTDGGTTQAGYQTTLQFINTVLSHFDNVASGKVGGLSGIATDDARQRSGGVWAQGFDTYLKQSAASATNGYTANVAGFSAGYDVTFLENFIFGLKGGLAWDTIRSRGPNTSNRVNSYEAGVYGSYGNKDYYVDGIFSAAYNDYNSKRHVAIGGINLDPWASYGGWQYSAYGETGYTLQLGKFRFTPLFSMQYMRLNVDGYTEKDGGAANLTVESQGYNLLESGLGARLSYLLPCKGFTFIPDVHFKWLYDIISDGEEATSTFTGGGAAFTTAGFKPPRSSYNIGTRWVFLAKNSLTFSINYDCQLRPDFYSNSGYGSVRYDF